MPTVLERAPRALRDPPDAADVLTQQTAVLAEMMAELRHNRQAQPARPQQLHDPADPPEDPHFMWERLALPPETNFTVPSTDMIQRMATSLFAKVPLLSGRDQQEARFVLQVVSTWPDLSLDDRHWVFQRLNVYCIVTAGGYCCVRLVHGGNRIRPSSRSCVTTTGTQGKKPEESTQPRTTAATSGSRTGPSSSGSSSTTASWKRRTTHQPEPGSGRQRCR